MQVYLNGRYAHELIHASDRHLAYGAAALGCGPFRPEE